MTDLSRRGSRYVAISTSPGGGALVASRPVRDPDPQTFDPDGRRVVFDAGTRLHLALGRPKLMNEVELVLGVVANPDHREVDPIPGRERFYRRDLDPRRWLRVVVDFNDVPGWVVTAMVQRNPPRRLRP